MLTTLIFNPTTGQSLSIPKLSLKRRSKCNCMLGYDPIENQYKLLSITSTSYQVLTLGSGKLLWRKIKCSTKHYPRCYGICINGILYYRAAVNESSKVTMVVWFDIRTEKFDFIKVKENFRAAQIEATLINYNGKLAACKADTYFVYGNSKTLKIWVLEDPKKKEWSQHIHILPPLWKYVVGKDHLYIVGVIGTDEIVLSPNYDRFSSSFYLVYYNTKKRNVVKVEIRGMEASTNQRVYIFVNHVENLKLLS